MLYSENLIYTFSNRVNFYEMKYAFYFFVFLFSSTIITGQIEMEAIDIYGSVRDSPPDRGHPGSDRNSSGSKSEKRHTPSKPTKSVEDVRNDLSDLYHEMDYYFVYKNLSGYDVEVYLDGSVKIESLIPISIWDKPIENPIHYNSKPKYSAFDVVETELALGVYESTRGSTDSNAKILNEKAREYLNYSNNQERIRQQRENHFNYRVLSSHYYGRKILVLESRGSEIFQRISSDILYGILLDIPPNGVEGSVFRRLVEQPIEVLLEIAFKGA